SPLTHRHRSTVSKNWARSPLTNDCGGNECTQTSASVRATTPASSSTSRSAATAGCSPGSRMPVTGVMRPLSARSTRSTSSSRTTTAVTPASHNSSCPIFSRNRRMKSRVDIDRTYLPTDLCEPRVQPVAHCRPLSGKDRVDDRVSDMPVRQDPVTAKNPVLLCTESLDRGARLTVVEVSQKLHGDAAEIVERALKEQPLRCGVASCALHTCGEPGVADLDAPIRFVDTRVRPHVHGTSIHRVHDRPRRHRSRPVLREACVHL